MNIRDRFPGTTEPSSMPSNPPPTAAASGIALPHPGRAALLSFLVPGLGQIYQGRVGKGLLFMVFLLGTFFFGMRLGGSQVVYWDWTGDLTEVHYYYISQMFIGLPALPALLQATATSYHVELPLPAPIRHFEETPTKEQLNEMNNRAGKLYEFGKLYTMVAGLLNILVIYDAFGGPAYADQEEGEIASRPAEG